MPRAKNRPMRATERAALAAGLLRRWGPHDTAGTMADRFDTSKRRVVEALEEPFDQVRALVRNGATPGVIADETGFPHEFVAYAVRVIRGRGAQARRMKTPTSYEIAADGGSRSKSTTGARGGPRPKRAPRPNTKPPPSGIELADWVEGE